MKELENELNPQMKFSLHEFGAQNFAYIKFELNDKINDKAKEDIQDLMKVLSDKLENADEVKGENNETNEVGLLRNKSTYNYPIVHISFNDAEAYCQWLSKLHNSNYNLPTTVQWLYTASILGEKDTLRYEEVNKYSNLRDDSFCREKSWTYCTSKSDEFPILAPVNSFIPDYLGLFQIHGNISEWCFSPDGNYYSLGGHYQERLDTSKNAITFYYKRIDSYTSSPYDRHRKDYRSALIGFRVVKNDKIPLPVYKDRQKLDSKTASIEEKGSFNYQGRTYNWKRLKDGKKWMTENLNYEVINSSCNRPRYLNWKYANDAEDCDIYGRIYTWDAARKVCPKGWHLPCDEEWRRMISFYGGCDEYAQDGGISAYNNLIDGGSSEFAATLGGSSFEDSENPNSGYYWSCTERPNDQAIGYFFNKPLNYIYRHTEIKKERKLFCRCVQDD